MMDERPPRKKHYSHAFTIAFEIVSTTKDGSDVTAPLLREAITKRLRELSDAELEEAIGAPFDTYCIEGDL